MMKKTNKKSVKIKNLIGIVDNPTHEDLLFEIVQFLEAENRLDGEFKKWDVVVKTRCRIGPSLEEDLNVLIKKGFIEHKKYTIYKILKHPWESN